MAVNNANSDKTEKWYFTKEQLESTPSRKHGHDAYKELSYRQQAASFIQSMGQKLKVSQLCINTAIVYMHRFYVFHSFTHFPWYQMAAAALFLAAKVEEQPRKLEYVIRVANACRNNKDVSIDINSERYIAQSQELVFNENLLLQTLGFELAIDHPHTHVVRCCHLVRASKDLAQTSYFMASNSLHLTTMCLQYKPTVVACFCIHVACKWSNWEIPLSNEEREWFSYVDPTVTSELLQVLTKEFLTIFESCSSRLKEKIMAIEDNQYTHNPSAYINSPFDTDPKKVIPDKDHKDHLHRTLPDVKLIDGEGHKHRPSRQHESSTSQQQREREYREKKERERLAMQQQHSAKSLPPGSQPPMKPIPPHGHHRSSLDPKMKMSSSHSRPLSAPLFPPANRLEPRDILRDASKDSPFGIASKEPRIETKDYGGARGDKDALKHPSKLTVNEVNSVNSYGVGVGAASASYGSDRSRVDPGRLARHLDPTAGKVRRHEDVAKAYPKSDPADNLKTHLAGADDNSKSVYLAKPATSTSQRMKSPFNTDSSKSVLKSNVSHHGHSSVKTIHQQQQSSSSNNSSNGTSTGSYSNSALAQLMDPNQIKQELFEIKQEPFAKEKLPMLDERYFKEEVRVKEEKHVSNREHKSNHHAVGGYMKKPSLFSPEKSPPQTIMNANMKTHIKSEMSTGPLPLSPLLSPNNSNSSGSTTSKTRRYSNSEPELRPVMQKIDQVEGFENLMRDPSIGVKLQNSFPESRSRSPKYQANSRQPEVPTSDASLTIMNGIETNPTLISNLLKESPAITINMPPVGANTVVATHQQPPEVSGHHQSREKDREHHHHKSKKKNKEKHKHKDKDKSKEEKEKKKKHKDKDREKHKHKERHDVPPMMPAIAEPIKIKIQKDKIQPVAEPLPEMMQTTGLKIKIPKDKIKTEMIGEPSSYAAPPTVVPSGGLKIKISKDVISGCSLSSSSSLLSDGAGASSTGKKRDRGDRWSPNNGPPAKMAKTFHHREQKPNGRHSHGKVAEMGEGELFLQRLAESKYTKGSS